jgi:hypothetical protein
VRVDVSLSTSRPASYKQSFNGLMSCTQHSEVSGFVVCEVKLLRHTRQQGKDGFGFSRLGGKPIRLWITQHQTRNIKGSKDEQYCQAVTVHIRQRNDESEMSRNANSPVPWFIPSEHHKNQILGQPRRVLATKRVLRLQTFRSRM